MPCWGDPWLLLSPTPFLVHGMVFQMIRCSSVNHSSLLLMHLVNMFFPFLLTNASGFELLGILSLDMVENFTLGWLPANIRWFMQHRYYFSYFWPPSDNLWLLRSCMAFFLPVLFIWHFGVHFQEKMFSNRAAACFSKAALHWIPESCKMWPKYLHAGRQSELNKDLFIF